MEYYLLFFQTFWNLVVEMSPWLLLGFFLAGILKVYIPMNYLEKHLGKSNFSSVVKAAIFGVPLPLCSCGVLPMATSLHKNGASKGAVSSFLISTPQTGIDSILATYALLGLPFAILRTVIAFISGIIGGVFTNYFLKENIPIQPIVIQNNNKEKPVNKIIEVFKYGFIDLVKDLAKWIVLGLFLATLVSILIPESVFQNVFSSVWIEFSLMILISVPMYVCATGSIPLAAVFALKGISPGGILIFLMLGPATNIASITVLSKTLGKKFVLIYLFSLILCSVIFGLLLNQFFTSYDFQLTNSTYFSLHDEKFNLLKHTSAIILIVLLFYSLFISDLISKTHIMKTSQKYHVEGMSCSHCKMSVEKNVAKLNGVEKVEVDLPSKTLFIDGNPSENEIKDCLTDLGFQYKGKI